MKVLIVSDIHGYKERFEAIVKHHPDAHHILSAGDSEMEAHELSRHRVQAVYGNAYLDVGEAMVVLNVQGHTLIMVHGHEHRVHYSDHALVKLLKKHNAQFLIHGHTHIARHTLTPHGVLINPGAVSRSRGRLPASYGILDLTPTQYTMRWLDAITHQELENVHGVLG